MPDDVYQLTIDDNDDWTLTLSDQGVAIPATHASTHAAAGADPITISSSQVTGLGSMATQASSSVTITGGTVTGITDLAVADGGTGASTLTGVLQGNGTSAFSAIATSTVGQVLRCTGAGTYAFGPVDLSNTDAVTDALPVSSGGTGASTESGARSSLGLVIGTDVQAYDAVLGGLAALTGAADVVPYFTGASSFSTAAFGTFARTLLANTDAATFLADLGVVFGTATLVSGTVTEAVTGLTAASTAIAVHSGSPTGSLGLLVCTPGTDTLTIDSRDAATTLVTGDSNDVFYIAIA